MSRQKPTSELQGHRTRAELARRKQAALPSFRLGYPVRPQGLPSSIRKLWAHYAAMAYSSRLLADLAAAQDALDKSADALGKCVQVTVSRDALAAELTTLSASRDSLVQRIRELEAAPFELQAELTAARATIARLETNEASAHNSIANLRRQLEQQKQALTTETETSTRRIIELTKKVTKLLSHVPLAVGLAVMDAGDAQ